jgi:hypothetical protein
VGKQVACHDVALAKAGRANPPQAIDLTGATAT